MIIRLDASTHNTYSYRSSRGLTVLLCYCPELDLGVDLLTEAYQDSDGFFLVIYA